MIFLLVMFLLTAVQAVVLELYGRPDYGELACGYLGMLLAGSVYLSSGMVASALTSSQVIAFLLPVFFWLIFNLACSRAPFYVNEFWGTLASACDIDQRLREFTIGLLDTSNIVFFLSLTAFFLMIAVRSLESRRWA
jgi:ABC-2 type transport system permease protein